MSLELDVLKFEYAVRMQIARAEKMFSNPEAISQVVQSAFIIALAEGIGVSEDDTDQSTQFENDLYRIIAFRKDEDEGMELIDGLTNLFKVYYEGIIGTASILEFLNNFDAQVSWFLQQPE